HGVILDREKDEIVYSCDCPDYLQEPDPCKHVWATIIEADAVGYLAGWERGGSITLIPSNEFPDETFDDDVDGPDSFQKIGQRIAAGILPAKSKGKAGAGWKHDFALLRQAMLAMPSE